jgi:L-asparaginase II
MLKLIGVDRAALQCGAHWPIHQASAQALVRAGGQASALHNNCSGKHAGMLATAALLGLPTHGYELPDHPVQIEIKRVLSETCQVALDKDAMGIDGCSVPTYAMPLAALANGFARFGSGQGLLQARAAAAKRLMQACFAEPLLIAGRDRFDTDILRGLRQAAFTKGGAEGVHCASLPEFGLGIALKIDDGAKRAAERALREVLAALLPAARPTDEFVLRNWRGLNIGRIEASAGLKRALADALSQRATLA